MQFQGTADYIADKDLMVAVNAAIKLERPLLVKGELAPARRNWPVRWQPPSAST